MAAHLDEVYQVDLINGYVILGHKDMDLACIQHPSVGTIVGDAKYPIDSYVLEYAMVNNYIIGSLFDNTDRTKSHFIIDTVSHTIDFEASSALYMKKLGALGIRNPDVYNRPPRR